MYLSYYELEKALRDMTALKGELQTILQQFMREQRVLNGVTAGGMWYFYWLRSCLKTATPKRRDYCGLQIVELPTVELMIKDRWHDTIRRECAQLHYVFGYGDLNDWLMTDLLLPDEEAACGRVYDLLMGQHNLVSIAMMNYLLGKNKIDEAEVRSLIYEGYIKVESLNGTKFEHLSTEEMVH